MAAMRETDLRDDLRDRRARLEEAIASGAEDPGLTSLLQEVDAALERMDTGTYGLCDVCHDSIEAGRLLVDPLIRTCLDHLTPAEQRVLGQGADPACQVDEDVPIHVFHKGPVRATHRDGAGLREGAGDGGRAPLLQGLAAGSRDGRAELDVRLHAGPPSASSSAARATCAASSPPRASSCRCSAG